MATIRVLVPTYNRSHLLPRALRSLIGQTYRDWICEVHNDAPGDDAPRKIVESLGDPRITCVDHPVNLGLTGTFNLLFSEGDEPFKALLEDDNWWEFSLLERLRNALQSHPESDLVWANMNFWNEESDGSWTPAQKTIWPVPADPGIRKFSWPLTQQVRSHVHSNGSALYRNRPDHDYVLPSQTIPGSTEAMRERSFRSPLLMIEQPLAHFAITRESARKQRPRGVFLQQILLTTSFLKHTTPSVTATREVWHQARNGPAKSIHILAIAAILAQKTSWFRPVLIKDIIWFWAWFIRHPLEGLAGFRARQTQPAIWEYLDRVTAKRAMTQSLVGE